VSDANLNVMRLVKSRSGVYHSCMSGGSVYMVEVTGATVRKVEVSNMVATKCLGAGYTDDIPSFVLLDNDNTLMILQIKDFSSTNAIYT
jgi:hypothetical protein